MSSIGTTPVHTPVHFFLEHAMLLAPSPLKACAEVSYEAGDSMGTKAVFAIIAFISMMCSLFVALTIFYNQKLSIHPSKLIGYICVCEAISCFNAMIWAIGPQ